MCKSEDISRKKMMVIVFGIILLQLCVSIYYMAVEKKGYYADDMYSYGSANSSGLLSPLSNKKGFITKINAWQDSQVVREYLTSSADEAFRFDNVKKVLDKEAHPPLYFYLLHFICSFTPDVFSKWSAFIINAVGLVILQIYLYRLALSVLQNRKKAVLIMTFFGFTSAVINMMCFLRMYILSAGCAAAYAFYLIRYEKELIKNEKANRTLLCVFTFLLIGALNDYLFIIFAFFISLYVAINLLIKRKIIEVLKLTGTALLAGLLFLLCFPQFFAQLQKPQPALEGAQLYPFWLQFRLSLNIIFNGLFGINTPVLPTMIPFYLFWGMVLLIILYLIAVFLFRNDEWFFKVQEKLKAAVIKIIKGVRANIETGMAVLFATVMTLVVFSRELMIFYYSEQSMRYLFILTPFVCLLFFSVVYFFVNNNIVCLVITVILCVTSMAWGDKTFLMRENIEGESITSATKDADVIFLERDYHVFMYHTADAINSKSFLVTKNTEYNDDRLIAEYKKKIKKSDKVILVVDRNTIGTEEDMSRSELFVFNSQIDENNNNIIDFFRTIEGCEKASYIGQSKIAYIYRLK